MKNLPIDLFRPYYAHGCIPALANLLTPDTYGRVFTGQGKLVDEFERQFAALVGAPDPDAVVSTASCTAALDIALKLAGVEHSQGHEVIAPPLTCTATSGAIVNAGARIVWADIRPDTGLIDPADVERKITDRTKAIVAVDWGGRACDYDALSCRPINWVIKPYTPIIEDAAHALLATSAGGTPLVDPDPNLIGLTNYADYVCYSFGDIKHLTTRAGGAIVTRRRDADRARKLTWHGLDRRSSADFRCGQQSIVEPGTHANMGDLNAAIGLANILDAEWVVARHRLNAAWYDRALAGVPGITLPPPDPGCSYWCYFLLLDNRDEFIAYMVERGIQCSPVHSRNDTHPAYHFPNGPLPGVDYYSARHVAIPVGWWVTERDRERIVSAIWEWAEARARAGAL